MPTIDDEAITVPGLAAHAWKVEGGTIEVWCEDGERHYFNLPPGLTAGLDAARVALLIRFCFQLYENAEAVGERAGVRDMQRKLRALAGLDH